MAEHDVIKTKFPQTFPDGFFRAFDGDVKLMLEKVQKVLRRYLAPFLSYRENPAGGNLTPRQPPSGPRGSLARPNLP